MANLKTAALSGLLVSKRDTAPPEHPGLEAAQTHLPSIQAEHADPPSPSHPGIPPYYKALTLKVDRERFTKLKNLGVQRDLRSQALMIEALDLLFSRHGI